MALVKTEYTYHTPYLDEEPPKISKPPTCQHDGEPWPCSFTINLLEQIKGNGNDC